MKLIDAYWATPVGLNGKCIGIIIVQDEITDKVKSYIGVGYGEDIEEDIEFIKASGSKFPLDAALVLTGRVAP